MPASLPVLPPCVDRKAEILYNSPTPKLQSQSFSALRELPMIISLMDAAACLNWLGTFMCWRKDKVASQFKISFCLLLLKLHSQGTASSGSGGKTGSKGLLQKYATLLKYCFLIWLFCQSHFTALTLDSGQTWGKNKAACIWHWGFILCLPLSWKTCRNVFTVNFLSERIQFQHLV